MIRAAPFPPRIVPRTMRRAAICLSLLSVAAGAAGAIGPASQAHAQSANPVPSHAWSFSGPLGTFDMAAVQRGYAVYDHVCSACHGMTALTYGDLGGMDLTEEQVARIAHAHRVPTGGDAAGKPVTRPATADDHLRSPYATPALAAAANHGARPPDQSRLEVVYPGGASRMRALLLGYGQAPPAGMQVPAGSFYNPYAANGMIAMPPPLHDGGVTYADGTAPTTAQQADDVVTFLTWAARPHLEERHRTGVRVVVFLLVLLVLTFCLKRRIWSDVH
ncbi:cytochrome c1 [Novacetimonas sp. GS1]|uniref:cytochrome c1 n=1 Tax=Novacetimonas sp. GS1 TaxID=3119990 RepID=UPI002FCD0A6B